MHEGAAEGTAEGTAEAADTPDGERVPGAVSRLAARAPWRRLPHPLRWLTVAIIGGTFVVVGIALLVLPGPGIAFILVGLAILATEFVWAEALLHRVKNGTHRVWRAAKSRVRPTASTPTGATKALPQPE
jgi:uncharacterized protein (TIGR02611 family)